MNYAFFLITSPYHPALFGCIEEEKQLENPAHYAVRSAGLNSRGSSSKDYEDYIMKDKTFENKVNRDVDRAKKDITALGEDNVTGLASIKKDLVTLGDDGVTGLSRKFEQLAGDTKERVTDTVKTLNKDVGHRLSQYNTKVQGVADKVSGGIGKKAARYPWVAMSIALAIGVLLGNFLLKPARQPLG